MSILGHDVTDIVACVLRPRRTVPEALGGRLGATLWAPCYGLNASATPLLDGARQLRQMGSKVIKLALFRPAWNYAVGSEWPSDEAFKDLRAVAEHESFREIWAAGQKRLEGFMQI